MGLVPTSLGSWSGSWRAGTRRETMCGSVGGRTWYLSYCFQDRDRFFVRRDYCNDSIMAQPLCSQGDQDIKASARELAAR
jgi:hypothetical protein